MVQYHPSEEWLALYASGAADEHSEALIAAHLTFCPECRQAVAEHERIAGVLLEKNRSALNEHDYDVESILNISHPQSDGQYKEAVHGTLNDIAPAPLVDYLYEKTGCRDIDCLNWSFYAPGIKRAVIIGKDEGAYVRLFRALPGAKFPVHHHHSDERTLVLTGAYKDHTGRFGPGDVQCVIAEVSHQPIVEDEGECIALVVSEKPAIPNSIVAKFLQLFIER